MAADSSATDDQPFVQRKTSTRKTSTNKGVRYLRFECPKCAAVKAKREDSFTIGFHMLVCSECGHSTDKVQQNGRVRGKVRTDHRSPDDAQR